MTDTKKEPYMFGNWSPPPIGPVKASPLVERESEGQDCGGTGHILPLERSKATFDVYKLTSFLDGGSDKEVAHRRWLWEAGEDYDNSRNVFRERHQVISDHVERFIGIHKKHLEDGYQPNPDDIMMMTNASRNQGAFGLHFGAFCNTIMSQGTPEQVMEWLIPAFQLQITGCLGQTELGHGSNVRALQTTATYDKATDEFILCTPTLKSMKWWPGGLGKTATHCVLYANLIIDGKEYGFHCFLMQLRDENHKPLPGIHVGEVGPKVGDNGTETGFLRVFNVRIPRTWMLMKNQVVHEGGKYEKVSKNEKSQYGTMLAIRSGLVMGAGYRLAQGVTIAVRYSLVRQQGFVDTSSDSRVAPERQILDYSNQQYRLFKQMCTAYAFVFTGKAIGEIFKRVMKELQEGGEANELAALHGTSSGLKALCTYEGAAGLEDLRKCCGGHGVLLASGIGPMALDYVTYNTAEGDMIILELQAARYLFKELEEVKKGGKALGFTEYLNDYNKDLDSFLKCNAKSASDFQNVETLKSLFRGRALVTVVEASNKLNSLFKKGQSFDEAWNHCAIDLTKCSRVHCYYMLLCNFADYLTNAPDANVRSVLSTMCVTYGLINLVEDFGSFELQRSQKAFVREAISSNLTALRVNAAALVDAFEFPDNVLNSAIGRYDGKVYESLFQSAVESPLNNEDPFPGYQQFLRPHLDLDFIAEHAKLQRADGSKSKL